jgi:hypothetical protein
MLVNYYYVYVYKEYKNQRSMRNLCIASVHEAQEPTT